MRGRCLTLGPFHSLALTLASLFGLGCLVMGVLGTSLLLGHHKNFAYRNLDQKLGEQRSASSFCPVVSWK